MEIPDSPVHKGRQNRRLLQADRDQNFVGGDNAHGDRHKPVFAASLLDGRDVHQDQGVAILHLDSGALLLIQRGLDVIRINLVHVRNIHDLRGRRVGHRDPAARLKLILLMHYSIFCLKNTNHANSPPIMKYTFSL